MLEIKNIIEKIEKLAPLDLAEEWDNTGWQIKLNKKKVLRVMLALSPTLDVIEQVKKQNCELLITHHPLFFSNIKNIKSNTLQNQVAIEAIKNNIQIYCAHTNLDKTKDGINDKLAELLELKNIQTMFDLVRVGESPEEDLIAVLSRVKSILNCSELKLINPTNIKRIKKVGICSGAGSDFINKIDADLFITGDVKYHNAIEVQNKVVVDAGHFETERIILPYLKNLLTEVEVYIAIEKPPWVII